MSTKTKLLVLIAAFLGSSVMAQEVTEGFWKGLNVISVQDLKTQIEALKVDKDTCKNTYIRNLFGNVLYHGDAKDIKEDEMRQLGDKVQQVVKECKDQGLWVNDSSEQKPKE